MEGSAFARVEHSMQRHRYEGGATGAVPPQRLLVPPILVYSNYCYWNITQRQDNRQ